ncbi:MAG TPA: DEAD/DEAH box helicase [Williamwhitmania sp.]|nr:DEAD/DEAH box helicase [Williamwhitmania sp.]
MSFENLGLIEPIQKALKAEGYITPTPIQEKAIPIVLQGRDLIGCAQTGTGKTAAFAIPIIQQLVQNRMVESGNRRIKALVVTPTRELAIQIGESFEAYGKNAGLRHTVVFGGVAQRPQTAALQRGVDILIATPGRLLDLVNQGFIHLNSIKIFVLDEADRMLDMGFIHDVKRIIAIIPKQRQTLFFSATMPPEITKLASTILTDPARVEVTPTASTADIIEQSVYFVDKENKNGLLLHLLRDNVIETALVFTRTKHGADKVVRLLNKNGVLAEAIHGNKSQNARQSALEKFKTHKIRVLAATDIAARGIDIDELSHVINFEMPNVSETYVHRIGRTGRAGHEGVALSFCDAEEKAFLKDIEKLISKSIPVVSNHPYPMTGVVASASRQATRHPQPPRKTFRHSTSGSNERPEQPGRKQYSAQGGGAPRRRW